MLPNLTTGIVIAARRTRAAAGLAIRGSFLVFLTLSGSAQVQSPPPRVNLPTVRDAAAALAAGNSTLAESDLRAILQFSPNDVHALNLLGILRAQQKRETEAEGLFRQAISIQPAYAGAQASLGLLYVQMGKDDLAIPPLQEALRLDPGREDAQGALITIWRGQAHDATQRGDLEKALALLIGACKVNPNDPDAQYDLGMVALRMSLFPDAITAFNQTLKLRTDDPQALYGLGRTQIALTKFDDAQQAFARYVRLRPDDASGHFALGVSLQALQHPSEARAEYEKSIALKPLQTESYFQLGLMELDAGNFDAAAEKFGRVLTRAPSHAGALTGMGRVRFQEKKYTEADTLLEKAVASDPRMREAHYYLGLTESRLGRKEESDKELAIASQIEHEEVEKHQNVLRILDPDQVQVPQPQANR
jgi:tetratricopeptide (TPR) repeat protein